jgi:hypothetical protein
MVGIINVPAAAVIVPVMNFLLFILNMLEFPCD